MGPTCTRVQILKLRYCIPAQYHSPQKAHHHNASWAQQKRCRYWAVSDIYYSHSFPKVKVFSWFLLTYLSQGKPDWCLLLLSKTLFCMNIDANDWWCEMGQKRFQNCVILFAAGRDDRADIRHLVDNDWSWVVTLDSRWHRYFCPYSLCRQISLSLVF